MDLNRILSRVGSVIVTVTVFLFALFLIIDIPFLQFLVCFFLPIGFIMMTAGLHHECENDRMVAGNIGMLFSVVYCTLIMIVYFTQITTVANESLNEQAARLIDFQENGLIFNYDLLGYGMMALSTLFTGLSMKAEAKPDKWLKALLILHGAFFPGCVFMPMTGMFTKLPESGSISGGTIALIVWCIYFLPVGILSFLHFSKKSERTGDQGGYTDAQVKAMSDTALLQLYRYSLEEGLYYKNVSTEVRIRGLLDKDI